MLGWLIGGLIAIVAMVTRKRPTPVPTVRVAVAGDTSTMSDFSPPRVSGSLSKAGSTSSMVPTPRTTPRVNRRDFYYDPSADSSIDNEIEAAINRELSTAIDMLASPLRGVTDDQWREFVRWARRAKLGTVSPKYELGMYLISPRHLADFGYMRNVRKVWYNDKEVWNGEWMEPYSKDAFLVSPALQYEVFIKVIMNRIGQIVAKYKKMIGAVLPGTNTIVSLSGLLGVSIQAGMSGLDKWYTSKPDKRFDHTSEAFEDVNGVF